MEIKSLTKIAYQRVSNGRDQVLQKNRGYGIVTVNFKDLIFAVPLRSNLNHPNGFKTILVGKVWNGLDYSKALLVESADITQESFVLRDQKEYEKIIKNKDKIINEFAKYLTDYITFCESKNKDIPMKFKFTTLRYFHSELGVIDL